MLKIIKPRVSVVIPSYNTCAYLKKMVTTIINQTYSEWELLIVDDGSTDGSIEMLGKYDDPRIKIILRDRNPKGGQTCRNLGLKKSTGEFVVFFDSDDLVSPNCLQQRVDFLGSHPDIDFAVFPAATFCDEAKMDNLRPDYGVNKKLDTLTSVLTTNYQFAVWTNIYRRSSLMKASILWDEKVKVYQDFDFNLSVVLSSLKYEFAENATIDYYYRIDYNKNSVCSNVLSVDKNQSTCYLFDKTLGLLLKRADYEQRKSELYYFALKHLERLVVGGNQNLLSDFLKVLSNYYKDGFYDKYHQKIISSIKMETEHKRRVAFWIWRILFFKDYRYITYLAKMIITKQY